MDSERWQRIESLYHAALEQDASRRALFLDEACAGDASLLREVQSLLEIEPRARDFIEAAAVVVAAPMFDEPTRLAPGESVGPYQIVSLLGRGGMGEVYRARDARLGRDVAVKVLPALQSSDGERLRRFEQEARAAGRLNHPNVLSIYDVGTHASAPYLVSELLEGKTLREVLARGALASRQMLDYTRQLAYGLAAAHVKGIVHRDLKPENVLITQDRRVKILDFGLAKLIQAGTPAEAFGEAGRAPTDTKRGVILGTLGYMAPEQVRGEEIDARADLFALGAIWYEMVTGRPAFRRDSAAATLSAVLKEEPPEIAGNGLGIGPGLERTMRRCLEKDPDQRFQSASDLAFALEALSGPDAVAIPAVAAGRGWRQSGRTRFLGLALALALGAAFLIGRGTTQRPEASPSFSRLTFRRGNLSRARLAPDGQTVIYAAAWEGRPLELFATRLGNPESRPLGLSGSDILSISRMGEMAILLSRRDQDRFVLAQVPLVGGSPRELLEDGVGADWTPDGKGLAVLHMVAGICRIEFPVGKVLHQTPNVIGGDIRFSPGGNLIAFAERGEGGRWSVAVVDLAGRKRTLCGGWARLQGLVWAPRGDEVWFTASTTGAHGLYAVNLSGTQRLVVRVPGKMAVQDAARDGRLLVEQDLTRTSMMLLSAGAPERDLSWFDGSTVRDLSSDGERVLFDERGEGGGEGGAIYLRDTDGSIAVRLGDGTASALSPDGKWVLALRPHGGSAQLVLLPTGAGATKVLDRGEVQSYLSQSARWFPDGRRVLFAARDAQARQQLYVQEVDGNRAPRAVLPPGLNSGPISPDGEWLATLGPEQQASLYSLATGASRPLPGIVRGDTLLRWSDDGGLLYVIRGREVPAKLYRYSLATGSRELWKSILPPDPDHISSLASAQITPDGRSIAYSHGNVLSTLYLVEGLK